MVGGSAAYGRGLLGAGEERTRVLKVITEALDAEVEEFASDTSLG